MAAAKPIVVLSDSSEDDEDYVPQEVDEDDEDEELEFDEVEEELVAKNIKNNEEKNEE